MTHEDRLTAALTAADEAHKAAQAQAEAAHRAIAEKSATALQVATDTYDAAMGEADRVLAGKANRATVIRAQAQEQALVAFDDAMRGQYAEPDAEVVTNAAGSLELRVGRSWLGGVVTVGTDSYRVDGPAGMMTFVSDPVKARAMLWAALAKDVEPAVA
jgi:multidrug efflux pump subunit AcrA (membrane-fusion protein)